MVIRGCIEGYSAFIMYLHCGNNNMASTVMQVFEAVVHVQGYSH